ncbi:MAG: aminopeptidase P N-terminal domain-containing protein [Candidatus Obscuribacterales bacterium]|nr:aminopeptidase P N-terminal domain-containing protein [Candidatus Obscuribacterales bacterium]
MSTSTTPTTSASAAVTLPAAVPAISEGEYRARIARFFDEMKDNSVAFVVGADEKLRSNDTDYKFRQSSDVLYLNGFPQPDAILAFVKVTKEDQKLVMFVLPKDPTKETWTGFREGTEGAKAKYFADVAFVVDDFSKEAAKMLAKATTVYYHYGHNHGVNKKFRALYEADPKDLLNVNQIVHAHRMIKSTAEIAMIRHAGTISAEAHIEAMKRCAREVGTVTEGKLQATLEFQFGDKGAQSVAYQSIVAGGNNANTLHYTLNDKPLKDGDLVLIDAACEFGGYASDITRTFPVNGKFSDAQREIYALVLKAQLAAIDASKPGCTLRSVHEVAVQVLREGLVDLGVLPAGMRTQDGAEKLLADAKAAGTEKDLLTLGVLYMHGTGHWMGLDVHDVAKNGTKNPSHKLVPTKAGNVFTVEPGLYFDANDKRMPARYRGIGVRIEDDVVITDTGCEVLTAKVPKSIDEIEALMAEATKSS